MVSDLASVGSELDLAERYSSALMNTFGAPQRVLVRGEGCFVWDADGRRYLDLLGGIAVNALGHAHPTLTGAIGAQLNTLGHVSNFFASPTQIRLAERLLEIVVPGGAPAGSRVFFTNSGTESIEAAIKLALKRGGAARKKIVALEGAFHGRSLGALSLTYKQAYKAAYGRPSTDVVHLPFGDFDALETLFATTGCEVAAFVVEPVQGEAGVRPMPPGYLKRARELTRDHGALLVMDEVQSGMGRTGTWMAHHLSEVGAGVIPDLVALAKGLGGGFPIGALVALGEEVADTFTPGSHGSTFGGNPVACAAGLATIHVIERDGLLDAVAERGTQLRSAIEAAGHRLVVGTRGYGLLVAIELAQPISEHVMRAALDAGYIVNAATPTTIRLAPPFVLSLAQVEAFAQDLPSIFDAAVLCATQDQS